LPADRKADLFAAGGASGPEPRRDVLTVRQLNERIRDVLQSAFGGTVWVKGEIQRLPQDAARRKHIYFELHETGSTGAAEFQIPVALMDWDRQKHGLGRYLDGTDPDLHLANQIEACFEAVVDFYPPFGKLSLKIVGVDKTYSLGRLEAVRREVLAFLTAEGLLERQKQLVLTDLPLGVGLITSPGSAAERDFMTGIQAAGRPFTVTLRGAKMQGAQLQDEVLRAMAAHVRRGVDVVVITRGGGSRADLSWFDQKDLAVAVARCPVPVITAIGHEIDRSICDVVAYHSCKTPTAAAEYLVDRVEAAAARLEDAAVRLTAAVDEALETAVARLDIARPLAWAAERKLNASRRDTQRLAARLQQRVTAGLGASGGRLERMQSRLAARTGGVVATAQARWSALADALGKSPGRIIAQRKERLAQDASRLPRASALLLERRAQRLDRAQMQARLLDPARLLARGYTLTLDETGQLVKLAADLAPGQRITTRFADGQSVSIVQPGGDGGKKPKKGTKRERGKETDPAQETLFR